MANWTERTVGALIARDVFQRRFLVVPNCQWTGHEADLLVVTKTLMVCDVEIKVSRHDLRADARKDKWWQHFGWQRGLNAPPQSVARDWPPRVWKHYYCMPASVWDFETADLGLSKASGILLVCEARNGQPFVRCERKARPNPEAKKLTAEQAVDIARLANLRMWDAMCERDRLVATTRQPIPQSETPIA